MGQPAAAQIQQRGKTRWGFCGTQPELFGDLVMWPVLALAIQGFHSFLAFLGGPASCCTACSCSCTTLSTEDAGSGSVLLGGCRSIYGLKGSEELPHALAFLLLSHQEGNCQQRDREVLRDPAAKGITAEYLFPVILFSVTPLTCRSGPSSNWPDNLLV